MLLKIFKLLEIITHLCFNTTLKIPVITNFWVQCILIFAPLKVLSNQNKIKGYIMVKTSKFLGHMI